jgi:hypothetical protein
MCRKCISEPQIDDHEIRGGLPFPRRVMAGFWIDHSGSIVPDQLI